MNAKRAPMLLILALWTGAAGAQESTRDLGGPGQYGKFLTQNGRDRWRFEGRQGETIIAHLASTEFDPILALAKDGAGDDNLLLNVDDPGSESRFAFRLPATGKYEIRVHAYKHQGGGNYTLRVQRFQARPLAVGKPTVGVFDRQGKSYWYFSGVKDQFVVPDVRGTPGEPWQALNPKGTPIADWAGAAPIDDDGVCYLVVSGPAQSRYKITLREARQRALVDGKQFSLSLQQGEMDVWSLKGQPGEFRLLEIEKQGRMRARFVEAPTDRSGAPRLASKDDRPAIKLLPLASRGSHLRFAAVLGRDGRYQLQMLAQTDVAYKLRMSDPSVPVAWDAEENSKLPLGGAAFYKFEATPGQLLQASLMSQAFVPVMRLWDARGSLVARSDDDGETESQLTHMALNAGLYRLQVSSLGDGGGGDFRLALKQTKLRELQVGGRAKGTLRPGDTEFWAFDGKARQTVFLNVRSATFEPTVSVRGPDGVPLAADTTGDAATGALLAMKLPSDGRYTVWVSSRRGAGEYVARLIDGD